VGEKGRKTGVGSTEIDRLEPPNAPIRILESLVMVSVFYFFLFFTAGVEAIGRLCNHRPTDACAKQLTVCSTCKELLESGNLPVLITGCGGFSKVYNQQLPRFYTNKG